MTDQTREHQSTTIDSSEPPPASTKSVVLGKDGKPCRACSTSSAFSSWAAETKKRVRTPTLTPVGPPSDCPPDVEALGRSSWSLLHSISAAYPVTASPTQQSDIAHFLSLFGKLYPCWVCAEDFQRYMEMHRVRTEGREELGRWMCEAHNEVNRKLGKPVFDCQKWEERWRTGWKDGRCD
ncbi:hypothetical protein K3495_g1101 [Podosphaera aphanis]|nr:hypothetical protein K3495_g1101 [Podosphaera aphanis]